MGRQRYVPLRHLGDLPLRCRWVFHLILVWRSKRRTDGTSLLRPLENCHDVQIRCRGDVPLRRLGDVPP